MKTGLKIISGVGSLFVAAPSGYGIYHVWDVNNPTGDKWLLDSGYEFNKPTFQSQKHLGHGCSRNLFKVKAGIDNGKLYGCAVMKMEKSDDNKFIKFNSEVAVRKGDNGWIINTRVENHEKVANSGTKYKFRFDYTLTKKDLKNESQTESWFFRDGEMFGTAGESKKLYIKPPSNENAWYESTQYKNDEISKDQLDTEIPVWSIQKEYYGVWVSKSNGTNSWIFQNIDVWTSERKYSEIFCELYQDNKCDTSSPGYEEAYKSEKGNLETWDDSVKASETKTTGTSEGGSRSTTGSNIKTSQIDPLMAAIKGISGDWVDMNEVCGLRKTRNLNEEEKNKLRIYCSRPTTNN